MENIASEIDGLREKFAGNVCIMGHHYQNDDVARHCDIMGDSLELARKIKDVQARHIVFCGVYFMGETAKLLAKPHQQIHLPEPDADCMMSLMASAKMARHALEQLNGDGRRVVPLAYVNTMLELKDVVGEYGGAVCTSANADKMLAWALKQGDAVLFLPDRQLGQNTASRLGIPAEDKYVLRFNGRGLQPGQEERLSARLFLWPGSCAIHAKFSAEHMAKIRRENPEAIIISHPECRPEVILASDGSGSTSYLIKETQKLAREKAGATVVIGTEENLVQRLANAHKGKLDIKPLGRARCPHMEKVTPQKLLATLRQIESGDAKPLQIDPAMRPNATLAIDRMLSVMANGAN